MNDKKKNKLVIILFSLLLVAVVIGIFIGKSKKQEEVVDNPINTPTNYMSDIQISIPNMTDEQVQTELNRELTQEEKDELIKLIETEEIDRNGSCT